MGLPASGALVRERRGEGREERERGLKKKGNASRGDSSASTRHYVAAGTNLYKRKTRMPRKVNRGSGRFAARTRTDRWRALHRTRMDRGDPRAYLLKGGFLIGSQPLFRRVYRCSDSCPGERGSKGGGERKRDPRWIRGRKASFLPPALTSYHFSIYTLIEIPYRPCLPFRACLPRRRVEGLNCPFIAFFSLSLSGSIVPTNLSRE